MSSAAQLSLLADLDSAIEKGSAEERADRLRRLAQLFVAGAANYGDDHVRIFDDVLGRLIVHIEAQTRAELSELLAPVENAPAGVVRLLAKDDDIAVAGPVLAQSLRIPDADLLVVAKKQSQLHLLAIASRPALGGLLCDVLVQRGDLAVVRNVAANPGARIAEATYGRLVDRAVQDDLLAETIGRRPDVPMHLFRQLVTRASDVVRARLIARAGPDARHEISRVLAKVSGAVETKALQDHRRVGDAVAALASAGRLDEDELRAFAKNGQFEETLQALSHLANLPQATVERLIRGERADPILILGRALAFEWPTVRAITMLRPAKGRVSADDLRLHFERLSANTAKRVVAFWRTNPETESAA